MAAPKGNNYNKKFSTPKQRKKLCDDLCKHLAQGLSMECFTGCSKQTLYNYMEKHKEDLDPIKIQEAKDAGRAMWEKIGLGIATGKLKGNSTAWIFNMKNRYRQDWNDRSEVDHTSGGDKITLGLPASPFMQAKPKKSDKE
jgi:hypothetical protein